MKWWITVWIEGVTTAASATDLFVNLLLLMMIRTTTGTSIGGHQNHSCQGRRFVIVVII